MKSLKDKILICIARDIEENGYSPSVKEIAELTHVSSTSTIHKYISELEEDGFIQKVPYTPRTLRITAEGKKALRKPVNT
jgi:repressor LexA